MILTLKARNPIAANKELPSDGRSFELRGASKKICRPISCVKIHSESIADIFFDIRPLQVVEIWSWRWIGNLSKNETTLIEPFSWHMGLQTVPIRQTIFYKWLQQRLSIFQEPLDHQMQLLDRKFPKLAFSSHCGIIMNSSGYWHQKCYFDTSDQFVDFFL